MNTQQQYDFAREMAEALNDTDALSLYISFVQKYKEEFLREILAKVLAMPSHKIRKTRGALFNYLVQQHDYSKKAYPGD